MAQRRQPCLFFPSGRCRNGDRCNYSHTSATTDTQRRYCSHFAKGRCMYGSSCKFSHDPADAPNHRSDSESEANSTAEAANYNAFIRWCYQVPRTGEIRRASILGSGIGAFIKEARDLVELDVATMQNVITALASEGGIHRLGELLNNQTLDTAVGQALQAHMEGGLLQLFQLLSHSSVARSVVVEVHRATIFNHLYGSNGSRAVRAFGAAVRYLALGGPELAADIEPCIVALSATYEVNTAAAVNNELSHVTETLVALAEGYVLTGPARFHCQRLRLRLGLADEIREAGIALGAANSHSVDVAFAIDEDLPGDMSSNGRRHDNDSENIADIQIMPTMEEIMSGRSEYLPGDDPARWHLGSGMAGLIDRQFRLVREDTVGQIRDAAHAQLQRLMGTNPDQKHSQARTFIYEDVYLVDTVFTQARGLQFVVGFPQLKESGSTTARREAWWEDSRRLCPESLVCLLGSDGLTVFLTVATPSRPPLPGSKAAKAQKNEIVPHDHYPRAGDPETAYVILHLVSHTGMDVNNVVLRFGLSSDRSARANFSLVEFSGVVLPSFYPTLQGLQYMSKKLDVPFTALLAPDPTMGAEELPVSLPPYAQVPGFKFDVSAISNAGESLQVASQDDRATEMLSQKTDLDAGQAQALYAALSRSLALIQGPPGTGKSYTGVALIKVLLANKDAARLGPIVSVAFTNHALDQTLCNLLDAGVTQIVRIGSRSKSERLTPFTLRTLSQGIAPTKQDKRYRYQAHVAMEAAATGMATSLVALRHALSDAGIMEYLKSNHVSLHDQLSYVTAEVDGFTEWRRKRSPTGICAWLNGNKAPWHPQDGLVEVKDLFRLSLDERHALYAEWRSNSSAGARNNVLAHLRGYEDAKLLNENGRSEVDMRVLSSANIIGVTTSGLARNLDLLREVDAKVLVVEEAGEVLEAHLLTAMLPSIEHAILIGDHQQLRPKAQNYDLSCEKTGSNLNFDLSLFERLVQPAAGRPMVPYESLEVQRRMHPSISQLIRRTLYPRLQDAPTVAEYPAVAGMRRRLFWLDHDRNEDGSPLGMDKTSHTNSYEVDMVFALVRHLVRQGTYQPSDIAVLTPYLGQLRSLRQALGKFTEVILNDRDIEELAQDGAGKPAADEATELKTTRPIASVVKSTLLQALRLATIDNFQGDEAQVVVISLVRSNEQRRCGFLKTSNRINVLLSRARHGMYIIGNTKTAEPVQMWHRVLDLLRKEGNVGQELELCCPRHPDTLLRVAQPENFAIVAPEAGCGLMCGRQLPCGHSCENKCHSEGMHNVVYCLKECTRLKKGCTHLCRYECGRKCDTKCGEMVTNVNIQLPCGHHVTSLPCYQFQDLSTYKCAVDVKYTVTHCGHEVVVPCWLKVEDSSFQCNAVCGSHLLCGHNCQKKCKICRPNVAGVSEPDHGVCLQRCGRDYTNCRHSCRSDCHGGEPCRPCTEPCEVRCSHSRCDRKCNEPCVPCAEDSCASTCSHSACNMPCAAPCDHVPCSLRCDQQLSCGHQCPLVCHSDCQGDGYCQVCAPDNVKGQQADLIMFTEYRDVDLSEGPCITTPCGHIFTLESLDGHMGMGDHYNLDVNGFPISLKGNSQPFSANELKVCPCCRGSLRDLPRYGRIVRRALLDESTKKFIIWSNAVYLQLAKNLATMQEGLSTSREVFSLHPMTKAIRLKSDSPLQVLSKLDATARRYRQLTDLRVAIFNFAKKVVKEEQPFGRVRELVEAARRRRARVGPDIEEFTFDHTILQTRGRLLASSLMIRTDVVAASDITTVWDRMGSGSARLSLDVDFARNRKHCETLIAEAESTMNHCQRVEGHIFWAHFVALECNVKEATASLSDSYVEDLDQLKALAERHLEDAAALCRTYAGSTASVSHEVDEVRRMLREQSYHGQMRMVFQAMATEFTGTGHWYTCSNGHPFTVGECGMPMQSAECPQCGAPIGGRNHEPAEGVRHAGDIEQQYGRMQL